MPGCRQGCLRGRWSIAEGQAIAAISTGPETIQLRPIQQNHCSLCAGLSLQRERVWWSREPAADTIVIDPRQRYLYFVLKGGRAARYGVGVGAKGSAGRAWPASTTS